VSSCTRLHLARLHASLLGLGLELAWVQRTTQRTRVYGLSAAPVMMYYVYEIRNECQLLSAGLTEH
jgi:hypothetical protein